MKTLDVVVIALGLAGTPAGAPTVARVAAPEPLADSPADAPANSPDERRARALFREVRCVVCQNETIADSQADIAADLRAIVREQVAAGRSDGEIRRFLVQRYGEFVLFRPALSWINAPLWLTPFAIVLAGAIVIVRRGQRRRNAPGQQLGAGGEAP